MPEAFAKDAAEARQFLSEYWMRSFEDRQRRARQIVLKLHSLRDRIAVAPMPQSDRLVDILRFTIQNVRNEIIKHGIRNPPPRSLHTVVGHLLRFADSCRRGSPFDKKVREKDFHRHLQIFLQGAANGPVESEVDMGRGRIDLLLDDTPIELKAQKLGKDPKLGVSQYLQQAANYASDRSVATGVLVVLDITDRTHEKQHSAPLSTSVDVCAVQSRRSIGGTSYTTLVVLVIEAFPPNPSSLSVKSKHRQSARATGTRPSPLPRKQHRPPRRKRGKPSRS